MFISWSIEGEQQLSRNLRDLDARTLNMRPAFEDAANYLKGVFSQDTFSSKGSVIGEPWAPLNAAYLRWKLKHGYPADILIRTGEMKKSFWTEIDSQYAIIGNSTAYFKYHQSNESRSKLPRRVMMKIANAQKTKVVRIFQSYFFNK
jgi:phage gpG-like protein